MATAITGMAHHRAVRLAAAIVAGGITCAFAQSPAPPAPSPDIARLQQRITALEQRLRQMEQKLAGGSTVTAPFTVADDDGNVVLRVSADEGAELRFGGDARAPAFHVRDSEDAVAVLVNGISGRILLSAGRDGASQIEAAAQGTTVARLSADPDEGASTQVQQGTGFGVFAVEKNAPRTQLSRNGKPFFVVESSKETLLRLGDAATPVLDVKGGANGATLHLAKGFEAMSNQAGQGRLELNGAGGTAAVVLNTAQDSGSLQLRDAQKAIANLGKARHGNPVLTLSGKGGTEVVALGEDDKGDGALWVNYGSGTRMGLIGTDTEGEGGIFVLSPAGRISALVAATRTGEGAIEVRGSSGENIASITQGQNGGLLQLANLAGVPMVEAGNNGSVGIVRAGPIIRTGGAMLGLPGSFIMGKRQ